MDINEWIKNLIAMMEDNSLGDSDHPSCPQCNNKMNFFCRDEYGDFVYGEGYWKCPSCSFKVSENEIQKELAK